MNKAIEVLFNVQMEKLENEVNNEVLVDMKPLPPKILPPTTLQIDSNIKDIDEYNDAQL